MIEELKRRNYAESTIGAYIRTVEHFSKHFHRPPDQLGPEHIRKYQAALFSCWKLPRRPTRRRFCISPILSQEEVARLIEAAASPIHCILLMTLYATGAAALR